MAGEAVACAILNETRDQVLLVKRRDVPVWVFPGGGIDDGECPEAACLREGLEETGLTLNITRKVAEYQQTNALTRPTHLFECSANGKLQLSDETCDIRYFALNDLPYHLPPPYPEWLEDTLKNSALLKKPIHSVTYRALLYRVVTHPHLALRFLLQLARRIGRGD